MLSFNVLSIVLIFALTITSSLYPLWHAKWRRSEEFFKIGEPMAAGVFLGASLLHMLAGSAAQFTARHIDYPWAFLLAGGVFLLFLLFEHICRELHHQHHPRTFALSALTMLSIHSFFAGAALGISQSTTHASILLLAILAHKWAESLALSTQIKQGGFTTLMSIGLLLVFATMTPLGIIVGSSTSQILSSHSLFEPILSALAAGTFLYLGTLHGLERATLIQQCCNLKYFNFVILGFVIMAVVAIWT